MIMEPVCSKIVFSPDRRPDLQECIFVKTPPTMAKPLPG